MGFLYLNLAKTVDVRTQLHKPFKRRVVIIWVHISAQALIEKGEKLKKTFNVGFALLIVAMLLSNIYFQGVSRVSAQEIPRDQIMWGAGYYPSLTNFNPIRMNDGMGWDTYLMYEPLFGTDVATGQLIKWLGEAINWVNEGLTIEVTLRSDIHWVKLTDAGPVVYRDITTEDVKYSYYLTGAFEESPAAAYWMDGLATRMGSMNNFHIDSPTKFHIDLKPVLGDLNFDFVVDGTDLTIMGIDWGLTPPTDPRADPNGDGTVDGLDLTIMGEGWGQSYLPTPYSSVAYRIMTRGILIVPKDVWEEIYATTDYLAFTNDWLDPLFNANWKVASGMYLPYYRNPELTQTILKKNDNWWGIGVLGNPGGPAPTYMGYLTGIPNEQIIDYVRSGFLDWDGSYIPAIWDKDPITGFPYSNTYFKNPPYFPDKSALLMVPNHRKWPIGEPWLDWALALTMDYPGNSLASSGYCVNGSQYNIYGTQIQYPNAFLIPKDDAIANELLINYPNKATYLIEQSVANAIAILNEHCYIRSTDGYWYTNDGPTMAWVDNLLNYYGNIDLTVGKVTKSANEWKTLGNFELADEDDVHLGVNVMLGPWKLLDIDGWTDVNAIDINAASTVNDQLNIPFTTNFLDWGGYTTSMDQNTYDFADYCMHWGINGDLYERYTQLFAGTYSGCWNHYGSYVNPTLEHLVESLDSAPDRQAVANQIFDIVGTDLPIIPMSGHPDWYIYSNLYWKHWPNEVDYLFLPASPYGGATQEADVLSVCLGLQKSP